MYAVITPWYTGALGCESGGDDDCSLRIYYSQKTDSFNLKRLRVVYPRGQLPKVIFENG